jgi:hypothetical protein
VNNSSLPCANVQTLSSKGAGYLSTRYKVHSWLRCYLGTQGKALDMHHILKGSCILLCPHLQAPARQSCHSFPSPTFIQVTTSVPDASDSDTSVNFGVWTVVPLALYQGENSELMKDLCDALPLRPTVRVFRANGWLIGGQPIAVTCSSSHLSNRRACRQRDSSHA